MLGLGAWVSESWGPERTLWEQEKGSQAGAVAMA